MNRTLSGALKTTTPPGHERRLRAVGFWAAVYLACLTLPSLSVAEPVVIYPRDGTAVTTAELELYGAVTRRVEVVKIMAGGRLVIPFVKPDRTFEQKIELQPGINDIMVGERTIRVARLDAKEAPPQGFLKRYLHPAMADGCDVCHGFAEPGDFSANAPAREMCTGCHDDPGGGRDGKPWLHGHSPVSDDGDCLACHDPHAGDTPQMTVKPLPDLCYECHDPVTAGKSRVHGPVGDGSCADCHGPHGGAYPALLLARTDQLCLECHDDPVGTQPVVHAALDDGCLTCHAPHASSERSLLSAPQAKLCGDCHDVVPASGKGVKVHSPIADDGECSGCHRPHASKVKRLLTEPLPGLCGQCHDDMTGAGKQGGSVHSPVAEGSCADCHNPHAGISALLTKPAAQLCGDCHDLFRKPERGSLHAPAGDGECLECHTPHASREKRLLQARGAALCSLCHDAFSKPEGGSLHDPVAGGDCGDCHDPHEAPAKSLLNSGEVELCNSCHDPFQGEVVHSPIADDGACTSCHSPHSAAAPRLLPKRGMAVCLDCHDDPSAAVKGKEGGSVHSPIGDDGDCVACHSPHAAGKTLLKAAVPALCYDCHDDVTKNGSQVYQDVHPPAEEGACLDCHDPHASQNSSLAVKNGEVELCLDCHDDPRVNTSGVAFQFPHEPVAMDCGKCHRPHGSEASSLLASSPPALCRECHPNHAKHALSAAKGGGMAKVPDGWPVGPDGEMVCGGCHSAHGADEQHLFPVERRELCGKCHSIF